MRISGRNRPATKSSYVERVNLAIDYILTHLEDPLRLADVARAAMFSPFHFHRVFQGLMGMTLAEFVKQRRLERALSMMSLSPRKSLTQVALASGFSSSSDFSRCFNLRFGASPREFDVKRWCDAHRAELEALTPGFRDRPPIQGFPTNRNPDRFKVKIQELPARTVAYIRVANPYKGNAVVSAVRRLVAWAERHCLADGQWLGYQWDNPEIVSLEDCLYHAAVEAENFTPEGEIGRFRFPPMVVAQVEIRGGIDLELRALQWLFGVWLPRSGFDPDDHPCFEAWIGRPFAHGMEHFEIYAQLPIRRH